MKFKPLPANDRFLISDTGCVELQISEHTSRPVAIYSNRKGYKYFFVRVNKTGKKVYVHRAVLMAHVGMPKDGMECSHIDGNPSNNTLSNLEWVSRKQNHAMKVVHGTAQIGERNPFAKLSNEVVAFIKAELKKGVKIVELARQYCVSEMTIADIKHNRTWTHI